jgi:hypothetical protein
MTPPSAVALFCEDIREEKNGAITLIGIMGDNATIPPAPPDMPDNFQAIMPKICVYTRLHFDADIDPGQISLTVLMPDGSVAATTNIEQDNINGARATRARGNPMAGITIRYVMGNFVIPKTLGRIVVNATIGEQSFIAGTLNFILAESAPIP